MSDKIIIIREKMLESIMKDFVTFLALLISMYLNYKYLGQSKIMSGFFILMFLMKSLQYFSRNNTYTVEQAKEYIDNIYKACGGIDGS